MITKKPEWIRGKISWGEDSRKVRDYLRELELNSVCVEASCPNKGECWEKKHVTFLILGDKCTRKCFFCDIKKDLPGTPDPSEPSNIAKAVKELGIKYIVITSVTRDDLPDQGTGHFVQTINEIKKISTEVLVELLIPDMGADIGLLRRIAFSKVEVVGHNIEMPKEFYSMIRPGSDYYRSLETLKILSSLKDEADAILVKSSIMLGIGEEEKAILETLVDLKESGVDIVYLGQYLRPSKMHWPVKKYYSPEEFKYYEEKALELGFRAVQSGPMVRSSYRAYESYSIVK